MSEPMFMNVRLNRNQINSLILTRWSSRSYLSKGVTETDLLGVLEAAGWAPSCFNEQPWRFLVARKHLDLMKMRACLNETNLTWAHLAPVLIGIISVPAFQKDGRINRWHAFDTGTAWGYLALEAHRRGLTAHAMGGFSQQRFRETYNVPESWGVHAIVALGYRGPTESLPVLLKDRERPTARKPLNDIWSEELLQS